MRPWFFLSKASGLLLLAGFVGCGGSSSTSVPSDTSTRADSPVTPIRVEYTVTDLGATDYYYSNYGYISNRYRYGGILRINDSGQIITNSSSQPTLYDGLPKLLTGANYGIANGLNNSGSVVGSAYYPNFSIHATAWNGQTAAQIDAALNNTWSEAFGVNNAGAIVGLASKGNDPFSSATKATLWLNGTQTDLGSLGGNYSLAYAVNSGGSAVGWSQITPSAAGPYYDESVPVHAFVWSGGSLSDLGILTGGNSSDAQDINDSGQIVGSANTAAQGIYSFRPLHAVTWTNGTMQDLGTLGGPGSIGYALNNAGTVVGSADTSTLAPQSTYYGWVYSAGGGVGGTGGDNTGTGGGNTPNTGSPLTHGAGGGNVTRTRSAGLRTRGIGDIYVAHAFRVTSGKIEDLNALINPNLGWELLSATDINDRGQIVGFGKYGNRQHAFLLTPVP